MSLGLQRWFRAGLGYTHQQCFCWILIGNSCTQGIVGDWIPYQQGINRAPEHTCCRSGFYGSAATLYGLRLSSLWQIDT